MNPAAGARRLLAAEKASFMDVVADFTGFAPLSTILGRDLRVTSTDPGFLVWSPCDCPS
jgi:hypothetical protein